MIVIYNHFQFIRDTSLFGINLKFVIKHKNLENTYSFSTCSFWNLIKIESIPQTYNAYICSQ